MDETSLVPSDDSGGESKIVLAQAAAQRLRELEVQSDGNLQPSAVVQDAKKESSPLHSFFDWNKDRAAEAHWLDQARKLIRCFRYISTIETTKVSVPYYVRNPKVESHVQGYLATSTLISEPETGVKVVLHELACAKGLLVRAAKLAMAAGIKADVSLAISVVNDLRDKLQGLGTKQSESKKGSASKPAPASTITLDGLRGRILKLIGTDGPQTLESIMQRLDADIAKVSLAVQHIWFERAGKKYTLSSEGWRQVEKGH